MQTRTVKFINNNGFEQPYEIIDWIADKLAPGGYVTDDFVLDAMVNANEIAIGSYHVFHKVEEA